jgi:ABC-2 type transport system ATP-binding protein
MAADILLQTNALTKKYKGAPVVALDNLTLQVAAGEVYGFLGANGAGKSTTIRTLLGFLAPTSGSAQICGLDIVKDSVAVKHHVGYLSGEIALYPKVTGHELFAYLSKLQQKDNKAYLKDLISRFEAEPEKPIGELSKGNRQKIGVIQALMHQPDVLILDEPTSGLDPLMQEVFYDTIREASSRGAAVFVSSHNLAEAQRMCDRIGIIKHGKLIREQSIKDDAALGAPTFRVVLADTKSAEKLRKSSVLKVVSVQGPTAVLQPSGSIGDALKALGSFDIKSFTTEQLNLEDEFLEYYGDGA